jgi:hypothetical protein
VEEEEDDHDASSGRLSRVKTREEIHFDHEHEMKITAKRIIIPDWLVMNDWERSVLEILRERIKQGANEGLEDYSVRASQSIRSGCV